ncbi:hypothetical protein OB08_10365 [Microbacterium sp. HJ5]
MARRHYSDPVLRRIIQTGPLTDAQIKDIYSAATRFGAQVRLWNEGFGPNREYFKWGVQGSIVAIAKTARYLRTLR